METKNQPCRGGPRYAQNSRMLMAAATMNRAIVSPISALFLFMISFQEGGGNRSVVGLALVLSTPKSASRKARMLGGRSSGCIARAWKTARSVRVEMSGFN